MKKLKKSYIYKKNKLLKMYSGMSQKGVSKLYLYTISKNFRKNLDQAEQEVAKQKSKKKKHANLIFFLVNICIIAGILIYQISNQEDMSISALLDSTFNPSLLLVVILVWICWQALDAMRTMLIIKMVSGKVRPILAYKSNAIGRYYDNITPMATGGQPFQIFYLKNRGLNAAASIFVPMGRYVANQLCISVFWTICTILALFTDLAGGLNYIKILCVIGWAVNSLLMITVLILTINQKVGKKIVVFVLKFLQKIKLLKDYEKSYKQVIKIVSDFQIAIKNFLKDIKTFVKVMIINFIYMIIMYSMAFLVYCVMIGHIDFSMYFEILFLNVLIDIASSFIPLPGGTGVSELSFTTLFSLLFSSGMMLTWALILWRIFTYYSYLLQGILIMAYDNAIGNRRYLWLKKKWELEEESITFTQDKLHEYQFEKKHKSKTIF